MATHRLKFKPGMYWEDLHVDADDNDFDQDLNADNEDFMQCLADDLVDKAKNVDDNKEE
jgi:hypothetical protein